jgi:hypothetical protein
MSCSRKQDASQPPAIDKSDELILTSDVPAEIKMLESRTGYYVQRPRGIYSLSIENGIVLLRQYDKINGETKIVEEVELVYDQTGGRKRFRHPEKPLKYEIFPQKANDFLVLMDKYENLDEAINAGILGTTDFVNTHTGKFVYDTHTIVQEKNAKVDENKLQEMWVYITTNSGNTVIAVNNSEYEYNPSFKQFLFSNEAETNDAGYFVSIRSEYSFVNGVLMFKCDEFKEDNTPGEEMHGINEYLQYRVIFKKISEASPEDDAVFLEAYYEASSGR